MSKNRVFLDFRPNSVCFICTYSNVNLLAFFCFKMLLYTNLCYYSNSTDCGDGFKYVQSDHLMLTSHSTDVFSKNHLKKRPDQFSGQNRLDNPHNPSRNPSLNTFLKSKNTTFFHD